MAQPNIDYLSADIGSPLAKVQMDITDIKYPDDHFDVIICNHVLEHIPDDWKAMAELYRVLKPRGWAILQVPISLSLNQTYEDPLVTSPEERERAFGQNDHVRIYAKDYRDRLERVGFSVEIFSFVKDFGESSIHKYGLSKDENIYVCSKPRLGEELTHDVEYQKEETCFSRFKLLSHLVEGQKALEIGCGYGDLSVEIAKLGFDVVGVDISEPGIQQAVELAKKEKLDAKAQFMVMDAASLEFPDNSFDTVLIPEALAHIIDSRKLMEEAVRVIRNGGRIIVSVPNGLVVPSPGQPKVFSAYSLGVELKQYTKEFKWHNLPSPEWLVRSFFVKKPQLDIAEGPLIDILMPTYNGRKYIRNAVKSVVNQTYRNWNLVVVNDGGEDIKDIIAEFKDARIKYITAEHKGKAHALNVGIKNSRGEFIGYLDDDDILYPIHLEVLVKAALEGKKDFVHSDWYEVSLDESNTEVGRKFEHRVDVAPWMLIPTNYINHKCILHRRSLLEKTGLYDEELDLVIDWDMIRRLAFVCPPQRVASVTSERMQYYSEKVLENRITSLRMRDPDRARKSIERVAKKTVELPATEEQLKDSIVNSMLGLGPYHYLEFDIALQARDAQFRSLLQAKDAQITNLQAQIQQMQHSIPMQLVSKYQRMVEKLLRRGTLRRYYYELGLTGIRVILNEGWGSFFTKAWYRLRRQSPFDVRYARTFGGITLHDTLIEAIRAQAKRKSVIYDIGAFSGAYSIYLAHKVKQSLVYSFEPVPQAFNELIKNIESFRARNITAMNVAISDHIGKQPFYVSSDAARSSFYPSNAAWDNREIIQSIEVNCVTIDHLVESGKIPPPDIIKIDVEGHEYEVVKGAEKTIGRFMPMIFYEPHGTPEVATSEIGTSSLLSKYGYECKSLGYPIWCYRKQVDRQSKTDKEVTKNGHSCTS
jgi:FkbM family methyltransferase